MNRRNFFKLSALALAGEATRRMWPFRVYSIPKEIKFFGDIRNSPFTLSRTYFIGADFGKDPSQTVYYVREEILNAKGEVILSEVYQKPAMEQWFHMPDSFPWDKKVIVDEHAEPEVVYLLPPAPPPEPIFHEGPPQIEQSVFDYLEKMKDQMAMITGVQPGSFAGESIPPQERFNHRRQIIEEIN
jgi:hypothetical protein